MIYGYHINDLKYTNNIPARIIRFCCFLLFHMKPDTIYITISGITDLHYIPIHFKFGEVISEYRVFLFTKDVLLKKSFVA